jgi:D-tyrosyl-tRNA(Tyr) deacylase
MFIERAQKLVRHVGHGQFGADMQVSLGNDGPVTIVMESDVLKPAGK